MMSIKARKENIRKNTTVELKTYEKAYKEGQIYKFARDEARAELKRREQGKTTIKRKPQSRTNDIFGNTSSLMGASFKWKNKGLF
jgi:hypothetical protein